LLGYSTARFSKYRNYYGIFVNFLKDIQKCVNELHTNGCILSAGKYFLILCLSSLKKHETHETNTALIHLPAPWQTGNMPDIMGEVWENTIKSGFISANQRSPKYYSAMQ